MLPNILPIAPGSFPAGGAVISTDRYEPVIALAMMLAQDGCADRKVAIWVEQIAGFLHPMAVIADVDLTQAHIDAGPRPAIERGPERCAGVSPRLEAVRVPRDIQCPRPRDESPAPVHPALLQCHGEEHDSGDVRLDRGGSIGSR